MKRAALLILVLALAACGSSGASGQHAPHPGGRTSRATSSSSLKPRPQVIEPTAGIQSESAAAAVPSDPVGDIHAHAAPLAQVRRELHLELVYAPVTGDSYINPLRYVNHWERTDQGVDATMPIGAPILAPGRIKILAVEPDWYAGQPLVYWELLDGLDAGQVQYVAEEITDIARPGLTLEQGQVIARYARSGTGIEFGWSTPNGTTLAVATSGYEEGQVTPAGRYIRQWLNRLGANAGNG